MGRLLRVLGFRVVGWRVSGSSHGFPNYPLQATPARFLELWLVIVSNSPLLSPKVTWRWQCFKQMTCVTFMLVCCSGQSHPKALSASSFWRPPARESGAAVLETDIEANFLSFLSVGVRVRGFRSFSGAVQTNGGLLDNLSLHHPPITI